MRMYRFWKTSYTMNFQAYTIQAHAGHACIQAIVPDGEQRTPTHLVVLVDVSYSMVRDVRDPKLENVKSSLRFLLDYLGPNDQVSIVTFSDKASTILRQTVVTPLEKENIRARISIISAESNTNISAAFIEARSCLHANAGNMKQGILLLTDGIANMGIRRPDFLVELVTDIVHAFPGTSISCIGYGMDHNADLLQSISGVGGGSYYVVHSLDDVATVFGDVLGGLISCSYQQVRILLPLGTSIQTRYTVTNTATHTEVVIGDLSAGTSAVFLATLPANTAVIMKGFDIANQFEFERTVYVMVTEDAVLQTNGNAHYLRFEVLSLLGQARQLMSLFVEFDKIKEHSEKIDRQIRVIEEYKREHPHSLWDILLHELQQCKGFLENYKRKPSDVPDILLQHGACLGRMRGIAASSSDQPASSRIRQCFSSPLQREISEDLSQNLSQANQEEEEPGAAPRPPRARPPRPLRVGSAAADPSSPPVKKSP